MTYALMSTQVFLTLAIVENNRCLMRPILPVTTLFLFFMSVYRQWLEVKELLNACLYLLDSIGMASSLMIDFAGILVRSFAFGVGVRI